MTEHFGSENAFAITGQPAAASTWPATKLRWLWRHEPEVLERARHILMIKDFIQLRLSGEAAGELSTRAFSYLFDVRAANYWPAMLDFCGISRGQLPPLVAPGMTIGAVLPAMVPRLPSAASWAVNAGTLDHFASMLPGYGNIDWAGCIAALKSVGYDGYLNLECSTSGDPARTLPATAEFLTRLTC